MFMDKLQKLFKKASKIEEAIVVLVFILMVLASFTQVVNRNLLHLPIGWPEEVARYCQVYLALLATELGLRDGSQMSLTMVVDKFKGKTKQTIEIVAKFIVTVFSILIFVQSISIIKGLIASGQRSPALKVPMFVPYLAIPISFGITALVESGILIQMISALTRKGKEVED